MSTLRRFAKLEQAFHVGEISRRNFLKSASALGIVATAPYILGAAHAQASASETYDYIVIGAGSAGCAVAARLGEDANKKILVLEAGPPDTEEFIHVPAAFPNLFKTPLDWNYTSTPQKYANDKQLYMPRGKVFGGSSSINAMIYMRGSKIGYDNWGKDNPGWHYHDVLPYFKKAQNQERGASAAHGTGGPLNVADLRDPNPLSKAMVQAAIDAGYPANDDFNDGDQDGFGLYQVTQKDGFRASAATSYLHPAIAAGNVIAQGESLVKRLFISDGKCTGVIFDAGGEEYTAITTGEVILSGGSFGSPQILMLSGIGPKVDLDALGIDVVLDLPGVGQNLHDHFMVPVAHAVTQEITLAGATAPEQFELLKTGMGLLTSNIGEAGGFLKVRGETEAANLQFHFAPGYFIQDGAGNPKGHGMTLLPGVVATKSRGQLTLASADPMDKPIINPGTYSDSEDLEVLVEGVKIARKIMAGDAFAEYRGEEFLPGVAVQSDDQIRDFIRKYSQTIYHPVGTCKMGSDDKAVVDAQLKVHGIAGLRVADASIMPTIVNGNTNAPSIMIGEKCADMVSNTG